MPASMSVLFFLEKTLTVTMKEGDYLKHLEPAEQYYIQIVGKASVDSLYENDVWRDQENVQKSSVTRFSIPNLTVEVRTLYSKTCLK